MEKELQKRKTIRLKGYDYNKRGIYFITVCTKDRKCILSRIIKTEKSASAELSEYGRIAEKYLNQMNEFYGDLAVLRYVIMPNHVHFLLYVKDVNVGNGPPLTPMNGPSGTPVPTGQNSRVSKFISTFKRFCNKEIGTNIWQYRSYDHIIRNAEDYEIRERYILENPMRWYYDELYSNR